MKKNKNIKAKVVAYKGYLIFTCLADKSEENVCTLSVDNPDNIGQAIHNTKYHLGISKQAVRLLEQVKRSGDDLGEIDFWKCTDNTWNFSWLGGIKRIVNPNDEECTGSNNYQVPNSSEYISIKNEIPKEAKEVINKW
jgi:hypothetical protein